MADEPLYWFHLVCFRDDGSEDGEVIATMDLDDFQMIFDIYNRQFRINLSGNQVEEGKAIPSLVSRLANGQSLATEPAAPPRSGAAPKMTPIKPWFWCCLCLRWRISCKWCRGRPSIEGE